MSGAFIIARDLAQSVTRIPADTFRPEIARETSRSLRHEQ
jgi:hypothetical protein